MDCRDMFYDPINPLPKKCPKCGFPDLDHVPRPSGRLRFRCFRRRRGSRGSLRIRACGGVFDPRLHLLRGAQRDDVGRTARESRGKNEKYPFPHAHIVSKVPQLCDKVWPAYFQRIWSDS